MAKQLYAFQGFNKELMARVLGRDLRISLKQSVEVCKYLRHRKLAQSKRLLQEVLDMKRAIPFRTFTNGLGHRKGHLGPGRYPQKTAEAFLKLLESVEANAQTKGLNTSELEIIHICAHKGAKMFHHGRHYGRLMKNTHVEIVVKETPKKEDNKKQKKTVQKAEVKK